MAGGDEEGPYEAEATASLAKLATGATVFKTGPLNEEQRRLSQSRRVHIGNPYVLLKTQPW